jgi:hypothetical protein
MHRILQVYRAGGGRSLEGAVLGIGPPLALEALGERGIGVAAGWIAGA